MEVNGLKKLGGGQVHFDGCHSRLKEDDPREWGGKNATFSRCAYEQIVRRAEGPQKNLADLFPGVS